MFRPYSLFVGGLATRFKMVDMPLRFKEYISWLLSSGRKEMGIVTMRKAVSLHPERAKEYITFMTQNGFILMENFRHPSFLRCGIFYAVRP